MAQKNRNLSYELFLSFLLSNRILPFPTSSLINFSIQLYALYNHNLLNSLHSKEFLLI
nr:MAG TPA: hypothetical protein [Caudoviricetes sp.]